VLTALNNAVPMEEQNGRYFTMWYGVYNKKDRRLAYASGGHPPALLIGNGQGNVCVERLVTKKMFIGGMPGMQYRKEECVIEGPCRLYIFCDGAFEITRPDESIWQFDEFVDYLVEHLDGDEPVMDRVFRHIREMSGSDVLDDDFSFVEVLID
jgi:sigma-B regulation protein RsbU (phosphoserine phosphatase)